MSTRTDPRPRISVEEVRRILDGPLELVIDTAESYWIEDETGDAIPPSSDRTLAPLFLALGLIREGRSPDDLTLYAWLADGERYRITSGISLVGIAEHAAGIRARPRSPGIPLRVDVPPLRRVVVDPIAWRDDPDTSAFPRVDAVSILFSPASVTSDGTTPAKADPGSTEFVLDGAEAYWLEDREGARVGPESDRSLALMHLAVGLARERPGPDELTFWARLADGQRFEICGGPSLIELTSQTTGIPHRPEASPLT